MEEGEAKQHLDIPTSLGEIKENKSPSRKNLSRSRGM